MRHTHLAQQRHIFANLLQVFGLGSAELKVYHMGLLAISHHTVGASFFNVPLCIQT